MVVSTLLGDSCTFVPGEAVLSAPSDVGHCQDPPQVSHIQQVGNTDHRQDREAVKATEVEELLPLHKLKHCAIQSVTAFPTGFVEKEECDYTG